MCMSRSVNVSTGVPRSQKVSDSMELESPSAVTP